MRIETELKLGFKDVMIRPKRSTLKSRSQVTLERDFKFLHSNATWQGIPIIAANMDTVGTFEMASTLSQQNILTAVHKHYNFDSWKAFDGSQTIRRVRVAVYHEDVNKDFRAEALFAPPAEMTVCFEHCIIRIIPE